MPTNNVYYIEAFYEQVLVTVPTKSGKIKLLNLLRCWKHSIIINFLPALWLIILFRGRSFPLFEQQYLVTHNYPERRWCLEIRGLCHIHVYMHTHILRHIICGLTLQSRLAWNLIGHTGWLCTQSNPSDSVCQLIGVQVHNWLPSIICVFVYVCIFKNNS